MGAGSPPRAWGQQDGTTYALCGDRFTPTCVGTTGKKLTRDRKLSVHPHVRGDNVSFIDPMTPPSGSPPRAWGQRNAALLLVGFARFTPTCVGTTSLP